MTDKTIEEMNAFEMFILALSEYQETLYKCKNKSIGFKQAAAKINTLEEVVNELQEHNPKFLEVEFFNKEFKKHFPEILERCDLAFHISKTLAK